MRGEGRPGTSKARVPRSHFGRSKVPIREKRKFFQKSMLPLVDGPSPDHFIFFPKVGILESGTLVGLIPTGGPFGYIAI